MMSRQEMRTHRRMRRIRGVWLLALSVFLVFPVLAVVTPPRAADAPAEGGAA